MFWRIIGVIASLTFIGNAIAIWVDPSCVTISTQGGRFIQYACYPDNSGGTSASTVASTFLVIGLALLTFNAWPFIRAAIERGRTKPSQNIERPTTTKSLSKQTVSHESAQVKMHKTKADACKACGATLKKSQKFCSECGKKVKQIEEPAPLNPETGANYADKDTDQVKRWGVIGLIGVTLVLLVSIITTASSNSGSQIQAVDTQKESSANNALDLETSTRNKFSMSGYYFDTGGSLGFKWSKNNKSCSKYSTCAWAKVVSVKSCFGFDYTLRALDSKNEIIREKKMHDITYLSTGKPVELEIGGLNVGATWELYWLSCTK